MHHKLIGVFPCIPNGKFDKQPSLMEVITLIDVQSLGIGHQVNCGACFLVWCAGPESMNGGLRVFSITLMMLST